MTAIAIMQPTFIPWIGYFELMQNVDDFIFLDDVQVSKQSWQTRNFFISQDKPYWKSIPVKGSSYTPLNEAFIMSFDQFIKKLSKSIYQDYPFFNLDWIINETKLHQNEITIADFNIEIIHRLAEIFEIKTQTHRASQLNVKGHRDERVINIVNKFSCSHYMATIGAREYMQKFGLDNYPFNVEFFEYTKSIQLSHYHQGYGFENCLETIKQNGLDVIRNNIFS